MSTQIKYERNEVEHTFWLDGRTGGISEECRVAIIGALEHSTDCLLQGIGGFILEFGGIHNRRTIVHP